MPFGHANAVLNIAPAPRHPQPLPILFDIMPALAQEALMTNPPPAMLVVNNVAHFISIRHPDPLTNRLIHRLAPNPLDFRPIRRLTPDSIGNRPVHRLNPHRLLFHSIALAKPHIHAIVPEAIVAGIAIAIITIPASVISIRLGKRRSRAKRCNGGCAREEKGGEAPG